MKENDPASLPPARLEVLHDRYVVNLNGNRLFRTQGKSDEDLEAVEQMIAAINSAKRIPRNDDVTL